MGNPAVAKKETPSAPSKMQIASVTRGRIDAPDRVLIYGVEGCGKSTWASGADGAIFLPAEDGTAQLDVARLPAPESWQDVLDAIEVLRADKHEYKTVVFDTIDAIEPLLWKHICERDKKQGVEDYGYGKGYVAALDEWRIFLSTLERLRRDRGMGIVLIAHSQIRTFKSPDTEDFDRYELKLNVKAGGLVKEWCDSVLFAHYETYAAKDGKTGRVRGVSSGARVISTQRTAAWDAKSRYALPETLPLNYEDYVSAVKARQPSTVTELQLSISAKLELLKDETVKKKVSAKAKEAGDNAAELAKIDNRLSALTAQEPAHV